MTHCPWMMSETNGNHTTNGYTEKMEWLFALIDVIPSFMWHTYHNYSTSGNTSKESQNTSLKEHQQPYVHCSIIYNHQEMETARIHQ